MAEFFNFDIMNCDTSVVCIAFMCAGMLGLPTDSENTALSLFSWVENLLSLLLDLYNLWTLWWGYRIHFWCWCMHPVSSSDTAVMRVRSAETWDQLQGRVLVFVTSQKLFVIWWRWRFQSVCTQVWPGIKHMSLWIRVHTLWKSYHILEYTWQCCKASGGPGSIPSATKKRKVVGLERGPLRLVSKLRSYLIEK
jgi:hypothetical protein